MKKIPFIIALMISSFASAQIVHEEGDHTIQPRLGLLVSNVTEGDSWKPSFAYGLEFEHFFSERFTLSEGLFFTDQGCNFNDDSGKLKMRLYYTTIPIMANFYVLPGLAIKAGIQPALRVKSKFYIGNERIDLDRFLAFLEQYEGVNLKFNRFDLSIPVGISYEYANFNLDARYNIGLTKVLLGSNDYEVNKVFVVTLGYKFSL